MNKILSRVLVVLSLLLIVISFFILGNNLFKSESSLKTPYYVLILGIDSEDLQEKYLRTDLIMVAAFHEDKINILSVPRDLLLEVNETYRRINSLYHLYGVDYLLTYLSELLEIELNDYIAFNYNIFKTVGDILSPVEIYIQDDMFYEDYNQNLFIDFKKGYNYFSGQELLYYIRFRHDAMGDLGRIERQKNAVFALLNAANSQGFKKLIDTATYVMNETENNLATLEMMELYPSVRKNEMEFIQFPYIIEQNYVLTDENKINRTVKLLKNDLENIEVLSSTSRIRLLVTKNFTNPMYNFYTYVFNQWKESGYVLKVLDSKIEGYDPSLSYVIIRNKINEEKLMNDLKKSFDKTFVIIDDSEVYYDAIKHFSKNLTNPLRYDVLVILND